MINQIISFWRKDLGRALLFYESKRSQGDSFFLYLFIFFVFLNTTCYWFAMVTAFPSLVFGKTFGYYFKVQFPVGILGALLIVSNKIYIAHLSIDLVIAALAVFCVMLVFIISGWTVSFIETLSQSEELIQTYDHEKNINKRTDKYVSTVNEALNNPSKNIQNIYFGIIMGISAVLPTMIHFMMFLKSSFYSIIDNQKGSKGL